MKFNNLYIEKKEKVELVVKYFLANKKNIREISEETGISKSAVHRYLNDEFFIRDIFGDKADFILDEIHLKLVQNKEEGNKLGGDVFSKNYVAIKDELGQFKRSRKIR